MNLQEQNILFFTRTMKLGGTENVILQLCEILQTKVNKIFVCSCGGVNVEVLNKMGIKHIQIDDIENKSIFTILRTIRTLLKIIKEEKITIIHTHHRMAAFYVSILGFYKKCVLVNTCHNTFMDKKILTKIAYKNVNLVACGEMVKKNLIDFYGLNNDQVTVIHNAVKPFNESNAVVDPLISRLHGEGKFVIGNIGRLSKQKGMEYYLKAIPIVVRKYPNTMFLVIGSGEDEEKLKKLVFELKIQKYVIFMGYRSDIQNIMTQLDLVILSSLWEGLPLTPIEAFSVGKTIVATAVDGTLEIVQDGINGYLVKPRDVSELSEKIERMIKNPEQVRKFEKNAKERYKLQFSFQKLAEKYIKYYEGL